MSGWLPGDRAGFEDRHRAAEEVVVRQELRAGGEARTSRHGLWKTEFVSNPDVVGKSIILNNLPFAVVGSAGTV
jgi:hypothetical protein